MSFLQIRTSVPRPPAHPVAAGVVDSPVVVTGNSATIAITAEGVTNVGYAASDVAGNVESTKSLTVIIDKTAPVTGGTVQLRAVRGQV